jgi:hypothetical protein
MEGYELTIHLRTCTYFQALYLCMYFSFYGYFKIDLCVPKSKKTIMGVKQNV